MVDIQSIPGVRRRSNGSPRSLVAPYDRDAGAHGGCHCTLSVHRATLVAIPALGTALRAPARLATRHLDASGFRSLARLPWCAALRYANRGACASGLAASVRILRRQTLSQGLPRRSGRNWAFCSLRMQGSCGGRRRRSVPIGRVSRTPRLPRGQGSTIRPGAIRIPYEGFFPGSEVLRAETARAWFRESGVRPRRPGIFPGPLQASLAFPVQIGEPGKWLTGFLNRSMRQREQ